MTLRNRIFVILSVAVLAILGITVALLVLRRPAANTPTTVNTNTSNGTQTGNTNPTQTDVQRVTGLSVQPLTATETETAGIKQFAKIFIERYYTYSSDSNFQNIRDVETLVTPSLWKQMSPRLAGTRSTGGSFVGITTRVYGTSVSDRQDTEASIKVLTQQSIEKDGTSSTKNQNYTVTLKKQGSIWLIDSVATSS